jgi:HSP90 family molecular chaperone
MDPNQKYVMKMSLNVLNHLGLNLYSNIPAVLSEVVANAYDADAQNVEINLTGDRIVIKDDGIGMDLDEINDKYLYVGYQKREHGEEITPIFKRKVMGRKGIGKLSIFSIANTIELHSYKNGELNALRMNRNEIQRQIKDKNGTYNPEDIEPLPIDSGTTIILTDLKKSISRTTPFLKRRLARRFTIIGSENKFNVSINGDPIGMEDREYFRKINFLWLIGEEKNEYSKKYKKHH